MHKIERVSDTALMVAACRAMETERPDGLVHDPLAARLAGHKGMAIARSVPTGEWMCFGVGLRSRFIDELVTDAVAKREVRTVVNLGAGLDTRPWRLKVKVDLRWIEVDLPEILDYKAEQLLDTRPNCKVERLVADLSKPVDRERVFEAVGDEPALMITEGLLMYLPREAVSAIGTEAAKSGICRWIFDVSSPELMRRSHGDLHPEIDSVRAADHLNGQEIIDAALAAGWAIAQHRSYIHDALKVAQERIMKMVRSEGPGPAPPPPDDPSGVYLLRRSAP
jgi:methyltransferase (TIGR00027 family)